MIKKIELFLICIITSISALYAPVKYPGYQLPKKYNSKKSCSTETVHTEQGQTFLTRSWVHEAKKRHQQPSRIRQPQHTWKEKTGRIFTKGTIEKTPGKIFVTIVTVTHALSNAKQI